MDEKHGFNFHSILVFLRQSFKFDSPNINKIVWLLKNRENVLKEKW